MFPNHPVNTNKFRRSPGVAINESTVRGAETEYSNSAVATQLVE